MKLSSNFHAASSGWLLGKLELKPANSSSKVGLDKL